MKASLIMIKDMKKVLLFTDILGSGGAQRQLVALACLLKDRGYHVLMLDYWDSDFYNRYLDSKGIEYKHVLTKGKWNIIKMFVQEVRLFSPQVVISYMENPSIIACIGKLLTNKRFKLIVSERNTTQVNDFATRIRMNLFRIANFIVPNSHSQEFFICKKYPFLKEKVEVITNVIDTNKFCPSECKNIVHETVRFIVVARVVEQKNVLRFIEAISIAFQKTPNFRVDWYGEPYPESYFEKCEQLVEQFALGNVISFYPATAEIVKVYQEADAFILPSIYEGFPNVLCEAMSCGLPVLASNVCDNPSILNDSAYGYLIDPLNVTDMADKISRFVMMESEQLKKMGQAARVHMVQDFSIASFINNYIKLIEN